MSVTTEVKPVRGGPVKKSASTGPVERDAVYSWDDFRQRTRWSMHALRTARRNGLKVIRSGGVLFIRGVDFSDYLASLAAAKESRETH